MYYHQMIYLGRLLKQILILHQLLYSTLLSCTPTPSCLATTNLLSYPIPHTPYPIHLSYTPYPSLPTRNPKQDIISNIGFYLNYLSGGNISWMVPVKTHGDRKRNGNMYIRRSGDDIYSQYNCLLYVCNLFIVCVMFFSSICIYLFIGLSVCL